MVIHSCGSALFVNYCVVGILKIYFRHSDFKSCYTIIIYCSKIGPRCLLRAIHIYLQLFVGGLMSYLRYLCLLAHSGVQHILRCVFVLFFFVLLSEYLNCPFLIVPSVFLNFYLKEAGITYHSPAPESTPGFCCFLEGTVLF